MRYPLSNENIQHSSLCVWLNACNIVSSRIYFSSISGFSFYGCKYQMWNALYTCFFWTFRFLHILTQCDKWIGEHENAYFSSSYFLWHFTKKLISRTDRFSFVHMKATTTVGNVFMNLHSYKENFRILAITHANTVVFWLCNNVC